MQRSEHLNELGTALAKAQALIKQPAKTKTASIKSEKGSYGYKYADLPDIIEAYRQPFSDNGLSIVQSVSTEERRVAITTILLHGSGQWIQDTLFMPVSDSKPQAVGSAISYGRRYAVAAMVGVAPDDDDDAHEAQGQPAKKPVRMTVRQDPRMDPGPRYDPTAEDIPFDGPPAQIGQADLDVYKATDQQKRLVTTLAAPYGIIERADLLKLSKALLANGGVEMEHIAAAVKEWADDRSKGR